MDPINIVVGLNIIATFGANLPGARKGLRSAVSPPKDKPKTYLQWLPVVISTITLIFLILGVFQIGTFEYDADLEQARLTGMIVYLIFSWTQVWAYRTLGESYSQDILIFKDHKLVTKGPFRFIRHPQYFSQMMMDISGGLATMSFLLLPVAVLQIPFLIMRGLKEDKLLERYFKEEYHSYKKRSGFMFPFLG